MLEVYLTDTLLLTSVISCPFSTKKHVTQNNLRRADVTDRIRNLNGMCD